MRRARESPAGRPPPPDTRGQRRRPAQVQMELLSTLAVLGKHDEDKSPSISANNSFGGERFNLK
jgi:hypothetical protein